jgi:hypothetical protein
MFTWIKSSHNATNGYEWDDSKQSIKIGEEKVARRSMCEK